MTLTSFLPTLICINYYYESSYSKHKQGSHCWLIRFLVFPTFLLYFGLKSEEKKTFRHQVSRCYTLCKEAGQFSPYLN